MKVLVVFGFHYPIILLLNILIRSEVGVSVTFIFHVAQIFADPTLNIFLVHSFNLIIVFSFFFAPNVLLEFTPS